MGTNYTSTDIPAVLGWSRRRMRRTGNGTRTQRIRILLPWGSEYRITERAASSVKVRKGKNDEAGWSAVNSTLNQSWGQGGRKAGGMAVKAERAW